MKDNVCFHRGEQREPGLLGSCQQEVGLGDRTVLAVLDRLADHSLDHVHITDHIVKGHHVCKRDLVACTNVAQSRKVLEDMLRQFVTRNVNHDPLKLVWGDVAGSLRVVVTELLTKTLCLESLEELCEFLVRHLVCRVLSSRVQVEPFAVKVKGDRILANVGGQDLFELVPSNLARAGGVEQAEGDLVLCVRVRQQVFEHNAIIIWSQGYNGNW